MHKKNTLALVLCALPVACVAPVDPPPRTAVDVVDEPDDGIVDDGVVDDGVIDDGVVDDGGEPVVVDGVSRPAHMRGRGFFVVDGQIFDPHGMPTRLVGFNHTHAWGDQQGNFAAVAEFNKTGANVVRVVFTPGLGADTPAERRAVVEEYLARGIVPMVEDHRTTCNDDPARLAAAVDEWLHPDNVAWLQEYEDRIILNIANEWMLGFDDNKWEQNYRTAIQRLRGAGLHHMLVVDAGGACGQNPRSIRNRGAALLEADPEHNVVFSVHMYGYWRTDEATDVGRWNDAGTQSPWNIRDELSAIQGLGLGIIVGELGWEGSSQVNYRTRPALQTLKDLDIGMLAWSWNWNSDAALDFMANNDGIRFDSDSDLSEGGRLFILDPEVGIRATAVPTTAFDD